MARLANLVIADAPTIWESLGFTVLADTVWIGDVGIRCLNKPNERGIVSWTLEGELPTDLDGIPVDSLEVATPPPEVSARSHRNGVIAIDHLVVMTPNIDRTVMAFETAGLECRRRREGAAYGAQAMRQAFFWFGDVICEVVGPEILDPDKANAPASFFGLALTSNDLDATAAFFGAHMKSPIDAVQPGRRIATLSSKAGSTVALAFMSPHTSV
jgi:hypothetical protein